MFKKIISLGLVFSLICLCFSGCEENLDEKHATREVFAMDTYMTLEAYGENSEEALDKVVEEINRIDKLLSISNKDSDIYRINNGHTSNVSEETLSLINTSIEIFEKTNGMFDITVYPIVDKWGFISKDYKVPEAKDIKELVSQIGSDKIHIENNKIKLEDGIKIDLGGIAKGYTSKRVTEILNDYNVKGGIVSLGGNVQCIGNKPDGSEFKVGIQNPDDSSDYIGIVTVNNKAVVTSGGYERYFEQNGKTYHHIIDPRNGYPAESGLKSVTIICEDGTYADALSTSMFVAGKDMAVKCYRGCDVNYEMVLVDENNNIFITPGLKDSFESDYQYSVL